MTPLGLLRLTARVLGFAVLLASGVYILVYLWRWEWIRAITSGLFFLAALIVISTSSILNALRRIEGRLDRLELARSPEPGENTYRKDARAHAAAAIGRTNAEHATRHFDWLREPPDRLSVFVPVLIGAGALLSGAAYLVERLAGTVARVSVDQATARHLALDLPLGPPPEPSTTLAGSVPAGSRRGGGKSCLVITAVLVVAFLTTAVLVIREATQNRPDPDDALARPTRVELEIVQRYPSRPELEMATALWVACRGRLPSEIGLSRTTVSANDRPTLHLDGAIGRFTRRRFVGCLEDATIDRVQATVSYIGEG